MLLKQDSQDSLWCGSVSQGLLVKVARVVAEPSRLLKRALKRVPGLPTAIKLELDLYDRPAYAYGIARAASEAKALGIPSITVIEFGVASGHGLLAMERIASEVERATGVAVFPIGFDTGKGLPPPSDYRDLPYLYSGGFYPMETGPLRTRLRKAELVLGDVRETAPAFLRRSAPPVGFVSIDLDYYSSTRDALKVFEGEAGGYLPRVLVYLDDIANERALQTRFTGELLAVEEFNDEHQQMAIDKVHGLSWSRSIPARWNDQMYAWHRFDHPLYNRSVVAEAAGYVAALE
jgi:hypothetical protein